ncbi:MAG: spondin domain-containing protein [Thermoanaerobaculia bacterium]
MRHAKSVSCLAALLLCAGATSAAAQPRYEVSITNLTKTQRFTPILVATHRPTLSLFHLGQPAPAELALVAEEGNIGPLAALLEGSSAVADTAQSSGLLDPGATVTVEVEAGGGTRRLSVVAMLIPTNDAFFALNSELLPLGSLPLTFYAVAYDSGSEVNDELCASIPGPFFSECGGPGGGAAPSGGEEGFVHVHSGIHGAGDFDEAARDWRNPVARIVVRRIS